MSPSTIGPLPPVPCKLRSRRNKTGGSVNSQSQGNGGSNSNAKMASTPMITSSSSSTCSVPSSSLSSSSSSSASKRGGVPFHHRPSYPAPRATTVSSGKENATNVLPPGSGPVEGVQDRANRSVDSSRKNDSNQQNQKLATSLFASWFYLSLSLIAFHLVFLTKQMVETAKTKRKGLIDLFLLLPTNSLRCPWGSLCLVCVLFECLRLGGVCIACLLGLLMHSDISRGSALIQPDQMDF